MKKALYTLIFTLVVTGVFITALAVLNQSTRSRVEQNQRRMMYQSILYAFNIFPDSVREEDLPASSLTSDIPWQADEVFDSVSQRIRQVRIAIDFHSDSVDLYLLSAPDSQITAMGMFLKGEGLWGRIIAFAAVSADLQRMIGIDFIEQSETPGLGARIQELWFKRPFRRLDIQSLLQAGSPVTMVNRISADDTLTVRPYFESVTGATLTSKGILDMINLDLKRYLLYLSANGYPVTLSPGRSNENQTHP